MGGEGSGRPPSVNTLIERQQPKFTPIGTEVFIPNYSGIKKEALKTDPTILGGGSGTAPGGGHEIQDEGTPVTTRSALNFSGSGVVLSDSAGATIVNIPGGGAATDHATLSNLDYATAAHTGFTNIIDFTVLSGSFLDLSGSYWLNMPNLSGAYYTHAGYSSDPHGATLTQTGIVSSGVISGSTIIATKISGAAIVGAVISGTSVIATNLSGVSIRGGTISGSTMSTVNFSGSFVKAGTLSGVTIYTTNFSGSCVKTGTLSGSSILTNTFSGSFVNAGVISGSDIRINTFSGSQLYGGIISGGAISILNDVTVSGAAYVLNTIYGTDATPPTASNYPIGTIYIRYNA